MDLESIERCDRVRSTAGVRESERASEYDEIDLSLTSWYRYRTCAVTRLIKSSHCCLASLSVMSNIRSAKLG